MLNAIVWILKCGNLLISKSILERSAQEDIFPPNMSQMCAMGWRSEFLAGHGMIFIALYCRGLSTALT